MSRTSSTASLHKNILAKYNRARDSFLSIGNKRLSMSISSRRQSNLTVLTNATEMSQEEMEVDITATVKDPIEEESGKKIIEYFRSVKHLKEFQKVKMFIELHQKEINPRELCKIIPTAGKLIADKTSVINVKFRLAGETWPPFILYKIVIEGLKNVNLSYN